MRQIQSCVLRLLVDPDHPSDLRGMVNLVEDDTEYSFRDGQDLVHLLKELNAGLISREHNEQLKGDSR
ncbi:MAG: hypothetical protein DRJ61_01095 [Acidobacteria bacterium]|nr:MAG: hypothetical protein DRJ65_03800 [Acidobacteriota bacterium]RLE36312.1 MAG: hypothetical protein DRJ61_01095 [Acidobacteriota bacterium]